MVPSRGNTRFAPLRDTSHANLARTAFAAVLESALHDLRPVDPNIPKGLLKLWLESTVTLTEDVRLIDIRDPELDRHGIDRQHLVATHQGHYPCTRAWSAGIHGRVVGGQPTHGLVWHSRQAELHAEANRTRPAVHDLINHHPAEVAVVWSPPASDTCLAHANGGLGPLHDDAGYEYVVDLANVINADIN